MPLPLGSFISLQVVCMHILLQALPRHSCLSVCLTRLSSCRTSPDCLVFFSLNFFPDCQLLNLLRVLFKKKFRKKSPHRIQAPREEIWFRSFTIMVFGGIFGGAKLFDKYKKTLNYFFP